MNKNKKQYEFNNKIELLNNKNVLITGKDINEMLKKYDIKYKVSNIKLFIEASTSVSYTTNNNYNIINDDNEEYNKYINENNNIIPLQNKSYDQLEFLGDAILRGILSHYLYVKYPKGTEELYTNIRINIEQKTTLSQLTIKLGLDKFILISKHLEEINSREVNDNMLEDMFEAFIGALYIDGGYDICKDLLFKLFDKYIDLTTLESVSSNYKKALNEKYHKLKWNPPEYISYETSIDKKLQTKIYVCGVKGFINGEWNVIAEGTGLKKKDAEQEAAKNALEYLDNNKNKEDLEKAFIEYINNDFRDKNNNEIKNNNVIKNILIEDKDIINEIKEFNPDDFD